MSEPQPRESGLSAPEQQEHSPQEQDPQSWAAPGTEPEAPRPWAPADQSQVPQQWSPPGARPQVPQQYDPRGFQPAPPPGTGPVTGFTGAEKFWSILGNIALGAMYLRKVSAKKALSDFGLARLNDTEGAWYTILCIAFGLGYFAKIPVAKAVSEMPQFNSAARLPAADSGN